MKKADLDYALPPHLIAQHPAAGRAESRLMVVDRDSGAIQHRVFADLPDLLHPGDLLVLNNSRVIPARLHAHRRDRSERIEVLLLRRLQALEWEALVRPGRKARRGEHLIFEAGRLEADVLDSSGAARRLHFHHHGDLWQCIEELGQTPLPPYIDRPPAAADRERYQTVYARVRGSVAAPTAGLHLTARMLERLAHCEITLHVGYGTFKPVTSETLEEHRMDEEYYQVGAEAAARIHGQLQASGRVIAVGTTTTRALEHVFRTRGRIRQDSGWTDLFIRPGFNFQVVKGLVTNFHLPGSTLLALVAAFAGKDFILDCYREAVRREYRFYSYGDAMLIL